jgi:DNA-binding NarL/FixJ family response regulator
MPDLNGIDTTRQIFSALLDNKAAALSIHSVKSSAEDMLQARAPGQVDRLDPETVPDCTLCTASGRIGKKKGAID